VQRTSIPRLIALALVGAVVAWLGQMALAAGGSPTLVAPVTLSVVLFGIAALLIGLGWPIRQMMHGKRTRRIDPFVAMRVVVFSKASSLTGALLTGAAAGFVLYALTRAAVPAGIWPDVLALVAAVVLGVAGLLVEGWCRIPPEDREAAPDQVMEHR
jgi:hypothetical protein